MIFLPTSSTTLKGSHLIPPRDLGDFMRRRYSFFKICGLRGGFILQHPGAKNDSGALSSLLLHFRPLRPR